MKYIKLLIIALLILIVFLAIFQNQEMFNDQYKFQLNLKLYETPAYYIKNYALIGIAFVFGIFLSIFLGIFSSSKKRGEVKSKNQRIKELEKEISNLQSNRAFDNQPTQTDTPTSGTGASGFNSPTS
jgi:cell division protein FtsB